MRAVRSSHEHRAVRDQAQRRSHLLGGPARSPLDPYRRQPARPLPLDDHPRCSVRRQRRCRRPRLGRQRCGRRPRGAATLAIGRGAHFWGTVWQRPRVNSGWSRQANDLVDGRLRRCDAGRGSGRLALLRQWFKGAHPRAGPVHEAQATHERKKVDWPHSVREDSRAPAFPRYVRLVR
jgi:hypothetical protein